jgi:hypothetical protein
VIIPHVKGSADFAVYEAIVIKPKETVMPGTKMKNLLTT